MLGSQGRARPVGLPALLFVALAALAFPATGSATFSASAGGEPAVTNTSTNSHFFDWAANADNSAYCITVYRNGTPFNRGCVPSNTTYYALGNSNTLSQTETGLADGTLVGTYPSEYLQSSGIYPCSGAHCSSTTLIDRNKPQLTVSAAGTAIYTNNPQIPLHIDYYDSLSHPWFAGGANSAVFICQRRDRACTNADPHPFVSQCSVANLTRFAAPGNAKQNSFDCMYDFTTEPDGPVYLCASAADQSVPDPDPTANEVTVFATHINQFNNPATGLGWTADKANLADSSCGSVILDRGAPTVAAQASTTTPRTGDLVTFTASANDGVSGIVDPYSWDFGDNTPVKQGASTTHTYTAPGTYHVVLTGQDAAGNPGTGSVDVVVSNVVTPPPVNPGPPDGSPDDDGTVVKPPDADDIGGDGGVRTTTVGTLKVIAPKKHQLGKKKNTPILLALTVTQPGTFQAALTKGPKVVSEGTAVLTAAGTVGFKLNLPKRLDAGKYQLQLTYAPEGAASATTSSIPIKFLRAQRGRGRAASHLSDGSDGQINVDAGPGLAVGYGG